MPIDNKAVWPGWETVRLIGRGSFGAVYEIERDVFGHKEKAALKVITIPQSESDIDDLMSDGYDEESITSRFEGYLHDIVREYSLMADMKGCANIVYCDDVKYIQHDNGMGWDIFIKMELLTALPRVLDKTVTDEQVIRIGRDICSALAFCEKRNLLHRDIKPQNIFMAPDGTYKLGDFGIAKTAERTTSGTKTGTYKYMAPEVYNNQPYGAKADIYSLGLVLYWLLNERRTPFLPLPPDTPTSSDEDKARARRFSGEPIPAPAHGSEELKRIVLKACAYDAKDRYQSAEEMLRELEVLMASGANVTALPKAAEEAVVAEQCHIPNGHGIGKDATVGAVRKAGRSDSVSQSDFSEPAEDITVSALRAVSEQDPGNEEMTLSAPDNGDSDKFDATIGAFSVITGEKQTPASEQKKKKAPVGLVLGCIAALAAAIALILHFSGKTVQSADSPAIPAASAYVIPIEDAISGSGQETVAEEPIPDDMVSADGKYLFAFVTDIGPLRDNSYNQYTYEGVKRAAIELGVSYKYYQPFNDNWATDDDRYNAMKAAVDGGATVIVCAGFMQGTALERAATDFPEVKFVFIDGWSLGLPNVVGIGFEEAQCGFLAGYAAVMEGYTKLGFCGAGGGINPAVNRYGYGYVQGAEAAAAAKGVDVEMNYTFLYGASFQASPELQTLVSDWYENGTEVVFSCGGGIFSSITAAAEANDGKVIGVDVDQSGESDTVITSALKVLGEAARLALDAAINGSWDEFAGAGGYKVLGVGDGAVALPTDNWRFNNWSVAEYEAMLRDVVAGKLVVDDNYDNIGSTAHVTLNIYS